MKIASGRRNAGMSERRLHQVDGRAAVEGVGGMGVAEPVRRDGQVDAGAFRRRPDHAQNGDRLQKAAALTGAEHGITWGRVLRPSARRSCQTEAGN